MNLNVPGKMFRARLQNVRKHVHSENAHKAGKAVSYFSAQAEWIDMATGERFAGLEQTTLNYEELFTALPDLKIEVTHRYVAKDSIIEQVVVSGTHKGDWHGIPATNKKVRFPLCSIYRFDKANKIKSESAYYDFLTILKQVGLAPDVAVTKKS
jgi:steroid delta-isomerase-like uncharacterized protein